MAKSLAIRAKATGWIPECRFVNEAVVFDELAVMCGYKEVIRSEDNDWLQI